MLAARYMLDQAGREGIQVASAGVFAMGGMSASGETQRLLKDMGLDASGHRARPLTRDLVEDADLVLVMDRFQKDEVLVRSGSQEKVHLLKAFGLEGRPPDNGPDIPDPIGKPLEVYEVCFTDLKEAVERVVRSL